MSPNELVVFDRPRGGREKSITLEKDRVYIVPEYQREIRWSTENVQVLIDDLKKGNKFLGTIILCTSEPKKFEIIDGQQRITSIALSFLLMIRNSFPHQNFVLISWTST
jgi:uncharacterized protein with ParB-like and HNH nuclease domain